ncbi:MAG TPA: hypothetical protein ENJ32_13445 [Crenotrichaceae bacterium]|nr:hypothetical protein [Crenotrichaceae bacterium]
MSFTTQSELRNIKKHPTGYQVQFIVHGKSYSGFEKELQKAIKLRDSMEKKLKVIPKGAFRKTFEKNKESCIPGTNTPMPVGITLKISYRNDIQTYDILVNWKDHTGKQRTKGFYCCRETTYSPKKMKRAYNRALKFRQAYEKAVLDETLSEFDPIMFNLQNK